MKVYNCTKQIFIFIKKNELFDVLRLQDASVFF